MALESAGKLKRFVPRLVGGERERRKLSLAPDIFEWVHTPAITDKVTQSKAKIRIHLGQFVKESPIDDCRFYEEKSEDRRLPASDKFLHEIWMITPRFNPQYRFFRTFPIHNWFVVFNKQDRDRLDENADRWHAEIDRAKRAWDVLFSADTPFRN